MGSQRNGSMVLLFELIVVNNWFVIVDGFSAAVGTWAAAFFVVWYIFGVLIAMGSPTTLNDMGLYRA